MDGRPPIFDSPEKMQQVADEYLKECEEKKIRPGIAKLCYKLGFESRQSFYDYEKREDFSYTVKRLRLWVESGYEEALNSNCPTGAIFALKNMGWKDKTETEISGSLDTSSNYDLSKLSEESLKELKNARRAT